QRSSPRGALNWAAHGPPKFYFIRRASRAEQRLLGFCDLVGNEAREREGCHVHFRRPVFCRKAARSPVTSRDARQRHTPQTRIVGGPPPRHVAATIGGNGRHIAAPVGE